ncbi:hypothetical protein FKM82_031284 [Ascaphus truei]
MRLTVFSRALSLGSPRFLRPCLCLTRYCPSLSHCPHSLTLSQLIPGHYYYYHSPLQHYHAHLILPPGHLADWSCVSCAPHGCQC